MTLPNEWFVSMRNNREFLFELLNPGKTPRVSKEVRKRAAECLKHFPMKPEIDELEKLYNTTHQNKNVILSETNKELQRVSTELTLANSRINILANALQKFVNLKEENNEQS